jgi:hypothetical protein
MNNCIHLDFLSRNRSYALLMYLDQKNCIELFLNLAFFNVVVMCFIFW